MIRTRRGSNSVAEWQLPKLHTRVRFPSPAPFFFYLPALFLVCSACVSFPHRLRWTPVAPPLSNLDKEWDQATEVLADGLRIKAMNNGQDLHLQFSIDDGALQEAFTGQFGQSVLIGFSNKSGDHSLRIDFKPKPLSNVSADAVDTVTSVISLEGPASEAYPRIWKDGSEGIEEAAFMRSGTLVYELRLPLAARRPGSFGLGVHPGDSLRIVIEALRLKSGPVQAAAQGYGLRSADPSGSFGAGFQVKLAQSPYREPPP